MSTAHWGSPFINSQGMKKGKSCWHLKGFIWTELKPWESGVWSGNWKRKFATSVERLPDVIAEALHKADKRKKTDVKASVTAEKDKTLPTWKLLTQNWRPTIFCKMCIAIHILADCQWQWSVGYWLHLISLSTLERFGLKKNKHERGFPQGIYRLIKTKTLFRKVPTWDTRFKWISWSKKISSKVNFLKFLRSHVVSRQKVTCSPWSEFVARNKVTG